MSVKCVKCVQDSTLNTYVHYVIKIVLIELKSARTILRKNKFK